MSFKQIGRSLCSWSKRDLAFLLIAGALAPMAAGIKDAKAMDADEAFTRDFMRELSIYGSDVPQLDAYGKGKHAVRIYVGPPEDQAPRGSILFVTDGNNVQGEGYSWVLGRKIYFRVKGVKGADNSPKGYSDNKMLMSECIGDGIHIQKGPYTDYSPLKNWFLKAIERIHIALYGPPGVDTSKKVNVKKQPEQDTAAGKANAGTATGKPKEPKKAPAKKPPAVDPVIPY